MYPVWLVVVFDYEIFSTSLVRLIIMVVSSSVRNRRTNFGAVTAESAPQDLFAVEPGCHVAK